MLLNLVGDRNNSAEEVLCKLLSGGCHCETEILTLTV